MKIFLQLFLSVSCIMIISCRNNIDFGKDEALIPASDKKLLVVEFDRNRLEMFGASPDTAVSAVIEFCLKQNLDIYSADMYSVAIHVEDGRKFPAEELHLLEMELTPGGKRIRIDSVSEIVLKFIGQD